MVKNNAIKKRGKADYIYENLHLTALDDGTYKIIGVTDKTVAEIEIPDCVSTIGDKAFYDCWNLINVTIPDSVKYIGKSAFRCCNALTQITLPESVTHIGNHAFLACSSLTNLTIPYNVKFIDIFAFESCNNLISVIFENKSNWFLSENESDTNGDSITVSDPSQNATNLREVYFKYCWKRV